MKTLHLTLKKAAFEVMITGEKPDEFRKPTQWLKSRLYNKDGSKKHYRLVKFTNGYGHHRPFFTADYKDFSECVTPQIMKYSNGLKVQIEPGDIKISFGKINIIGNI
jgi:hypothetical protein